MQRREFTSLLSLGLLGSAAGLAALPAHAQSVVPVEGGNYQRLNPPIPPAAGKLEVIEFFWYGCPHCYRFDPTLRDWLTHLPSDVSFRREHVAFNAMQRSHQRLFYTLEAMGEEARWHVQVLEAFHQERIDFADPEGPLKLMSSLGADTTKLHQAWDSFGVQSRCAQANRLVEAYNFDGVPAIGVGGRFVTAPYMAGAPGTDETVLGQRALAITNHLINLVRNKG